ncbi:N5,N10-methylene tetrahydromethanopterin reductase [Deinococcus aquiradiocola]|uniref:N5,N10-methylene tetrahydromethanopterin reductase n=1 Tax=Deinococcus aquiradiocola TaxID=393059 RepID=A0A917US21_9DEIO|nr:N5,N10-methylene tetrahydromethanopterin reductase [Deinococcus aquiradiocola]
MALAQAADRAGYTRYWVAEHHNMTSVVSSAPEVLLGVLATQTERIRVGSGGIMLPNHAPLKVAENFRTLEALAPGRIDLGIGRAPGTDGVTALALRGSQDALHRDDLPDQLAELRAYTGEAGYFPPSHPLGSVRATPQDVPLPPIYLLGSSTYSAQLAAQLGYGFAFAYHFSAANAAEAMRLYRETFRPSAQLQRPHAILATVAVAADTEAEAQRLSSSIGLSFLNIRKGLSLPLPSPGEALAYPYTAQERAFVEGYAATHAVGTPGQVRAKLEALAGRYGADELMLTGAVHDPAARIRSAELIAAAFGLTGAAQAVREPVLAS